MPYEFLEGRPFWVVYSALFGIVFCRAQATYWIGRGLDAGLHRSRFARRVGDRLTRAQHLINRFGPPAVTLSFMTVGIQTAVNLAAGAMRMRFGRYLTAMVIGCLIWAAIYSLGGLAVIAAWWSLFLHSPLLAIAVGALAATGVLCYAWSRRSRGRRRSERPAPEDSLSS
ncbi:membrane protein DedA with SNARE-associated domain [Spinactinospora alkalitolerans]|uniref:Membrane protein DedA with SNARE-associated domain n=1 Tax=Spinactinospora alkalitolerans TaxID=687207 RepID=A0A852TSL6_9ACTN|nr:VTT domain-containing protein [Spinactinospora alkalitolerans]NYE45852.1 membrane protein DedA with SNARE-associated domain [Spinactinospora alkalitolerans]